MAWWPGPVPGSSTSPLIAPTATSCWTTGCGPPMSHGVAAGKPCDVRASRYISSNRVGSVGSNVVIWRPSSPSFLALRAISSPARSRQRVHQLLDRHPRAGEKRRLLAGMSPGVGGPQFTHQIDDAVEFRSLEGQDPFVVAERERRHRVGPDVLVLAGGHA